MDETVQPILGRPVLTQSSESHRLTTIAVHTNATTPDGQSYDVLFMGTGQSSSVACLFDLCGYPFQVSTSKKKESVFKGEK